MAPFQAWHLLSLAGVAALAWLFSRPGAAFDALARPRNRRGFALGLLALEVAWFVIGATLGEARGWRTDLPLHLCDFGLLALLYAFGLAPGRARPLPFVYFLALPGTLLALLVPEIDPPGPLQTAAMAKFFVTHGLTVVGALHLAAAQDFRPAARDVFFSWLGLLALAVGVAGVNRLLGTNYMFVNAPTTAVGRFAEIPFTAYLAGYAAVMLTAFSIVAIGLRLRPRRVP